MPLFIFDSAVFCVCILIIAVLSSDDSSAHLPTREEVPCINGEFVFVFLSQFSYM